LTKNNVKNMSECWCYECKKDIPILQDYSSPLLGIKLTQAMVTMVVCPTCGNKRCPRATDHRLACTDSNDPGQLGSRYGVYPHPLLPLLDFVNINK
jgi:hypothetical protein